MYRALLVLSLWVLSADAASVSGIVKDPSGGVVAKAAVVLTIAAGSSSTSTDANGRFEFAEVPAGTYLLNISHDGFDPHQGTLTVGSQPVVLAITLELAHVRTTVEVSGGKSPLRNSDPNYQASRGASMRSVYRVKDLVLKRDAGTFTFHSGSFSFLPPVAGRVTTGAFIGDGNFALKPPQEIYARHLKQMIGADSVSEDFGSLVIYFTDDTFEEITAHAELADESPKAHQDVLHRVQDTLRHRDDVPQTFLSRLLDSDDIPNMEAEMLSEIYNQSSGSFRAFIQGRKNSGLRFIVNPRGAMPQLPAPDEVALIDAEPYAAREGIWYLAHTLAEQKSRVVSAHEEKRLVVPEHYRIETVINRSLHLSVLCDLRFHPVRDGVRTVKFDLLPDLQVSRLFLDGKEIPFVQENRKQDGSFYVELPNPLVRFQSYQLTFEYDGGEMIRDMGGKLFFLLPRQAWYPQAGATSRATYDLIFRVPNGMTVIATGDRVKSAVEDGLAVTEWKSDAPIPLAGFNYGAFMTRPRIDDLSGFPIDAYLGEKPSGFFMPSSALGLDRAENSLRIFAHWFGETPYHHLSVTEANFPDSMPGLLFVPTITMTDASSRYGSITNASVGRGRRGGGGGGGGAAAMAAPIPQITGPVFDESLARQVARQWWGNFVSPASFHDEWLVRGLADFAGSAYDMAAESDTDDFRLHWKQERDQLLVKTYSGVRRVDAAPVWLGSMAETILVPPPAPNPNARLTFRRPYIAPSTILTGMKGGYIIHMLRSLMFDPKSGDKDFIDLMHDFTSRFADRSVSTEEFQWLVEKHMKPALDLAGNRRMDWFFNEWVYGTELPNYRMEYSLSKGEGGKALLQGKVYQSGVSDKFRMAVALYGRFSSNRLGLLGHVDIVGNSAGEFKVLLPEEPKKVLLNANYDVLCAEPDVKQVK